MRKMLRLYDATQSGTGFTYALAEIVNRTSGPLEDLELQLSQQRGEVTIKATFPWSARDQYEILASEIRGHFPRELYSEDATIDALVATALSGDRHGGDPRPTSVAVAESLTAGMVAARLTDPPLSGYFFGGLIVYTDRGKERVAGVPADQLELHGAVSPHIAECLADAARGQFDATIGIGVTGVAGPGGGTPDHPVGTVFVSVVGPGVRRTNECHLEGNRTQVRLSATTAAMHALWSVLRSEGDTPGC